MWKPETWLVVFQCRRKLLYVDATDDLSVCMNNITWLDKPEMHPFRPRRVLAAFPARHLLTLFDMMSESELIVNYLFMGVFWEEVVSAVHGMNVMQHCLSEDELGLRFDDKWVEIAGRRLSQNLQLIHRQNHVRMNLSSKHPFVDPCHRLGLLDKTQFLVGCRCMISMPCMTSFDIQHDCFRYVCVRRCLPREMIPRVTKPFSIDWPTTPCDMNDRVGIHVHDGILKNRLWLHHWMRRQARRVCPKLTKILRPFQPGITCRVCHDSDAIFLPHNCSFGVDVCLMCLLSKGPEVCGIKLRLDPRDEPQSVD